MIKLLLGTWHPFLFFTLYALLRAYFSLPGEKRQEVMIFVSMILLSGVFEGVLLNRFGVEKYIWIYYLIIYPGIIYFIINYAKKALNNPSQAIRGKVKKRIISISIEMFLILLASFVISMYFGVNYFTDMV